MQKQYLRFTALDSWRGVGAIIVVIFHTQFQGVLSQNAVVEGAYALVDFFFVLSGFVIMHGYGDKLRNLADAKSFMIKRFARLYPLHLITLLISPPFVDVFGPEGFLHNALLITVFGLDNKLTWNVTSWSVAAEFWIYIVFTCAICVTIVRPKLRIGLFMLVFAIGALFVIFGPNKTLDVTYDYGFARCAFGFCLGVLIRRFWRSAAPSLDAHGETRSSQLIASLIEISVVVLVFSFMALTAKGPYSVYGPFFVALLVIVFAREAGIVSKILSWAPLRALGRWSYAIYLVHFPMIYGFSLALGAYGAATGQDIRTEVIGKNGHTKFDLGSAFLNETAIILFVIAVVMVGAFLHRFVEEPARKAISKLA
jgi:peptidoglycan/LPS O-acetylase OafA/YrhL